MSVYSPRVTTDRLPDYSDLDRFAAFPGWAGLPPAEKAMALWRYVTDRETGLYPVQGICEDPDPGPEYAFYDERDLTKVLNVHGHGYCGLLSPTLAGLLAHAGFQHTRITNMRENHHCVTEVSYAGEWHYFDVDLRGVLLREDGSVATLEEACTRRELWTQPAVAVEPFYPLDDKAGMFESFSGCRLTRMFNWYKSAHTMDFVLRPGEQLVRFWDPQDGRWFHPWPNPGGFDLQFLRRRFSQEPRGLKCKHPGWSRWTHGNGLLTYAPRLDVAHQDFVHGVAAHAGVEPGARGLHAEDGGWCCWNVRSPYIIVGRVVDMGPPGLIRDAATVSFRTLGAARLSVSTDGGHTWSCVYHTPVAAGAVVDLSAQVSGRYDYTIRFDFRGPGGLAELTVCTWVQLAPPSLPRLFAGDNTLSYATGDRYGYPTSVREIRLNLRDPAALERCLVHLDGTYQPLRDEARITGTAVLRVDAPPGKTIQWFSAGGYFHTHLGTDAKHTANSIAYATEGPEGPWLPVCAPTVPDWVQHWHYGMDQDVVLERPAPTIYLRYVGDPGVNQIWIHAHVLESAPAQPLRVIHGFAIDDVAHERTFTFSDATEYQLACAGEPENRYIAFAAPSLRTETTSLHAGTAGRHADAPINTPDPRV